MNNYFLKSVLAVMVSATVFAGCTKGGMLEETNADIYLISGKADGRQVMPVNIGNGSATFSGLYDTKLGTVTATVRWNNLWSGNNKDTLTSIKIFGPAAAGANGMLIKSIPAANTSSAASFGFNLSGTWALTDGNLKDILGGNCYYTLCTQKFPAGLVKGQLNAIKKDPGVKANYPVNNIVLAASNKTILGIGDTSLLGVNVEPYYANNKNIVWTSSNPAIVSVSPTGKITAVAKGLATITATAEDGSGVTGSVLVVVDMALSNFNRAGWTVTFSSEQKDDGGGAVAVLDGVFTTFWHNQWKAPTAPLPHWLLIDMQNEYDLAYVKVFRRLANTDAKTVVVEISNTGMVFTNVGTITTFGADPASTALAGTVSFIPTKTRYIKLTVTESNKAPSASLSEVFAGGYQ